MASSRPTRRRSATQQPALGWRSRIVGEGDEAPDQLLANPANWRIHPKAQQDALAGVLDEVGWVQRVIVNQRTGHLVDGHLRVALALRQDAPTVPVLYVDLDEAEEKLILATIDPVAALAAPDAEKLQALLDDVQTGSAAVQQMLADLADDAGCLADKTGLTDTDAVPDERPTDIVRGDLFQLGQHRLLCGDSTSAEDVARVMGGEKAGCVLSDPPYGQNQKGVPGDEPERLSSLIAGVVANIPVTDGVAVWFQSPHTFPMLLDAARAAGWSFERMLWLYKQAQIAFPWRGWLLKSEAILAFSRGNAEWIETHPFSHDCYVVSEVLGELDGVSGWHGSVKPIKIVRDILSRIGGTVYEPFSGSGTTLIACEQLNRSCYAIEIEPRYVQVAIDRWEQFTGSKAVKL